jgi:hypothetical protein
MINKHDFIPTNLPDKRIGRIKHLFRNSAKYLWRETDTGLDPGVPWTMGIFAGKAAARAPNNP